MFHINFKLLGQVEGYFARYRAPVGKLDAPIHFSKIVNETEYKLALKRRYDELQVILSVASAEELQGSMTSGKL